MLGFVKIAVGQEGQALEADGGEEVIAVGDFQASMTGLNRSWFSQR